MKPSPGPRQTKASLTSSFSPYKQRALLPMVADLIHRHRVEEAPALAADTPGVVEHVVCARSPVVYVLAVTNLDDFDHQFCGEDAEDDAVIANTNPVRVLCA